MKKYSFQIQLLVANESSGEKGFGQLAVYEPDGEVVSKLYLQEVVYDVVGKSYEAAKNQALIHAHEQVRTLAEQGRFSAFFLSCENKKGVSV
jgi:hypothetical protein